MLPLSDSGGRPGTVRTADPTTERDGHDTLSFSVPTPSSSGVHASKPRPAAGLRVKPSGSVTTDALRSEFSVSVETEFTGGNASTAVIPSGVSDRLLDGVRENSSSPKGTFPHFSSAAEGVVT